MQKNKSIIHGEEIASYQRGGIISGVESFPPQTYNLLIFGGIKRLQPILVGSDAKSFNHPTFTYRFNITCADLKNSTFIIDGLYYKGKQIPPLRVRFLMPRYCFFAVQCLKECNEYAFTTMLSYFCLSLWFVTFP